MTTFQKYSNGITNNTVDSLPNQNEGNENEIEIVRTSMREDIMKSESFLDSFCENVTKDLPSVNDFLFDDLGADGDGKLYRNNGRRSSNPNSSKSAVPVMINRRQTIDPNKKSKLLEALRAIDSN